MTHHRLPETALEPVNRSTGSEIRYPAHSGGHNSRSRKEEQP